MNPVRKIPQSNVNAQIKFDDIDNQVLYLDDTITTLSASFDSRISNITSSGGSGSADTGSLLTTASAVPFTSNITFTKGDGTTFTITTAADKANLSGGNNFTGDQRIIGASLTADTSIITPILRGLSTAKTDIDSGAGPVPILVFASGAYASLIVDGYIVGRTDTSYYAIQTTYVVINPANPDQLFFTTTTPILSPTASGNPPDVPPTFNTSSIVFSGGVNGTNVEIYIDNTSGVDITYKTIARAFPVI
jgi:hypothetical protein